MTSKNDLTLIGSLEKTIAHKSKTIGGMATDLADTRAKNVSYQNAALDHVAMTTVLENTIQELTNSRDHMQSMLATRDAQFEAQRNEIKGLLNMARIYASGGKPI